MPKVETNLTEQEQIALRDISRLTGKSENELIREAVDQLIARYQINTSPELMQKAKGIWKDRQDLPALEDLRSEWDR